MTIRSFRITRFPKEPSHMKKLAFKKQLEGTSLMVQWLRFRTLNAGDAGLIPDRGTRPHRLQ